MADHAASPEPEPAEPMKVQCGSDKLLSWVFVLWLLNAATSAAVAVREDLPDELVAGVFLGGTRPRNSSEARAQHCPPGSLTSPRRRSSWC